MGIEHIRARPGQMAYGMGLGVMLLEDVYPGFPGDVRNASAFPFPIQYQVITGVDIEKLVAGQDKSACLGPILGAAQQLEKLGCRAIIGECGYMAYFQREVAASLRVPVFLSSLLQVPMAQQLVGEEQVVGILMSDSRYLTEHHLESVGIRLGSNYIVAGAMDDGRCPEFNHLWTKGLRSDPPGADYQKAQKEFLAVAIEFYKKNPTMGAMALECTGFPPFARSLQREIDIPVFSWGTLMEYAFSVVAHRDYYGHV